MGKHNEAMENAATKRITLTGTLGLFALLLLFLVVTLMGTSDLTTQIRLMTEHPVAVNGNVNEAKTDMALMRIRTERLQSYNQPEDIEIVRAALEELYIHLEERLAIVQAQYLGPKEDIAALENAYEDVKEAQQVFLDFARLPTSTTYVIAAYEETNLYALYDAFEAAADQVLVFANNTQHRINDTAEEMSRRTVTWSIIIVVSMSLGLLLFQMIVRRGNQRLYQKNCQFDMLSNTIDETFLIFDQTKRCDFVSGNAKRVLGIEPESLRKDQSLVFAKMEEKDREEMLATVTASETAAWETTITYDHPGSVRVHWLQVRIYRTGEGGKAKYIVTLTDRTEEREASQALQDALVSAQEANNAKRDFLSRMSHEIRTPMNAIIGMTTIAAASMDDQRRVEGCLEKISYASKHLLMLINDVLDMSRIERNRMSIHAEPFELFQFLNGFVAIVYAQAQEKGLTFTEKSTGFSAHTTYVGDVTRLNQILFNLVSNALKFTPAGGKVSLEVTQLPSRERKCWLRFVVADTGIGMDEEGLEKLYTPFEQADTSISGKFGGSGLGMSITQNLVSLMGGTIRVDSKLGEGTTFVVELPFDQSEIDIHPMHQEALEALEVLVVDDEQDICEHASVLLEKMKVHAQWVLSGAEAVVRVVEAKEAGNDFDVCFIDWKMPEMDGVETARRIREKVGPDTPIIIISAYDWSEIEEEARAAGVNAFIAKPMFSSSLYNALVNVTNGVFGAIPSKTEDNEHPLEGMRLMVAEDNALNTEIVVTLLEMHGAVVESVENGLEAVKLFQAKEPGYFDAILMDVLMPVMDGCEAAKRIRACGREDGKKIPIIATTANAFAEDVAAVMAAGMNAHIGKPLDMEQLCMLLSRHCKR